MQELTHEEVQETSGGITVDPVQAIGFAMGFGAGRGIIMAAALITLLSVGN